MKQTYLCFTVVSNTGLLRELITECGVTPAFDPEKEKIVPAPTGFQAVWDTGATNSAISKKVVDKCSLISTAVTEVRHAGGVTERAKVYFVNIFLPNRVICPKIHVTEATLLGEEDILIGMDIISQGDFAVTNFNNRTMFSFRMPSARHIDFVKNRKTQARKNMGRRNYKKRKS